MAEEQAQTCDEVVRTQRVSNNAVGTTRSAALSGQDPISVSDKQENDDRANVGTSLPVCCDVRKKHDRGQGGIAKYVFGIGPEDPRLGTPKSRLIFPLSRFGLFWVFLNVIFLAYIAIVTPPMIAFYWLDDPCVSPPTIMFDTVLDVFFLVDILMNFCTGLIQMGRYEDNIKTVATQYLKGFFVFDLVTSFPVSFFELHAAAACSQSETVSSAEGTRQLRFVRAIKPLRLFKIARVVKLAKIGAHAEKLMDRFNVSPKQLRGLRVCSTLVLSIHMLSCLWWLWKVLFSDQDDVSTFLESVAWGRHELVPALGTHAGKLHIYVISMYVTTMTLTTVGYGDIGAENTGERIGYILLFVVGAFIWGDLLATVAEVHAASTERRRGIMLKVQQTLDYLIDNECPMALKTMIIQWTRFRLSHADDIQQRESIVHELPPDLQHALVHHLYAAQVSIIPLFKHIESVDDANAVNDGLQETFLSHIFVQLVYKPYPPGATIVNFSDPCDELIIFVAGTATVEFDHPTVHRPPRKLNAGDYIGDMSLLGERDWAKSTCFDFPPAQVDTSDEITEIKPCKVSMESLASFVSVADEDAKRCVASSKTISTQELSQAATNFKERWREARQIVTGDDAIHNVKVFIAWGNLSRRFYKKTCHESALHNHHMWKAASMHGGKSLHRKDSAPESPTALLTSCPSTHDSLDRRLLALEEQTRRSIKDLHHKIDGLVAGQARLLHMLAQAQGLASSGGTLLPGHTGDGDAPDDDVLAAAERAIASS